MTFADKIIIICIVFVSILSMLTMNVFLYNSMGTEVIIELDGKPYAKYNFNEITSRKFIEIKTEYGYNKVEIDNNRVRIVEASCSDQLCVSSGWIEKNNQMVVCLPNRLVVKIAGGNSDIDGVSY